MVVIMIIQVFTRQNKVASKEIREGFIYNSSVYFWK